MATDTQDASTAAGATPATEMEIVPGTRKKGRNLLVFGGISAAVGLAWAGYEYFVGSNYVSTDNAYVAAYAATVMPQTAAAVADVRVRDGQVVRRGDVLVVLDDADARLALAQAEAELARARDKARQYRANVVTAGARADSGGADIARNAALVASARASAVQARSEYERRVRIERSGAVSGEEIVTAKATLATAEASLQAAQAALNQARAARAAAIGERSSAEAIAGSSDIGTNAEVQAAEAAVDVARLNLTRTVIRAPIDGVVARRQVQVGERVAVGAALLTVVPVAEAYVEANFKETQLRRLAIGQPVTLTADRYGSSVVYHGHVQGIGGGTGSAFAAIPAQNATGNWIKVAQRLPVQIALDPAELVRHPLRVGLSMDATVDISTPGAKPAK